MGNVVVLDTPGPCGPVEVSDVTQTSCSLRWSEPDLTGGSRITNYIVERKEVTKKAWATIATNLESCNFKVNKLEAGQSYFFRVLAENEYGIGEPKETESDVRMGSVPSSVLDLSVSDSTKTSVSVQWRKPVSEGGCRL